MKKIVSLIVIALLFSMSIVIAENDTETTEPILEDEQVEEPELISPGTTPDSFLYFMDLALEKINLALTFDTDKRIEKELKIAEERLSEAREMALKGDLNSMTKAQEKHKKIFSKIKTDVKNIEGDTLEIQLKKELEVEQKINQHSDKVNKIGKELKLKIKIKGEPTPEQEILLETILKSLEGQSGEVEIEINNEQGKTKIKLSQETNKNGDEIEKELREEIGFDDENETEEIENELETDDENELEDKESGNKTEEMEDKETNEKEDLKETNSENDENETEEIENELETDENEMEKTNENEDSKETNSNNDKKESKSNKDSSKKSSSDKHSNEKSSEEDDED